ncbi:MAG: D-cysteine desulfhydrase family protein [Acidobacteria bacterium]|nr:D-cysteine desulfhydrase family protein [Acidobacteriota bacterium]
MSNPDNRRAIDKLNAVPRLSFGHYPTPVEELSRLRAELARELGGCPRIFLKRDDYTGPGFGGNKVRKLEYVLAAAIDAGVDVAITTGGVKSNHARVTAAMCAKVGLRCILVLNPAAVSCEGLDAASQYLDGLYGAEIVTVSHRDERAPKMEAVAARLRADGLNVSVIPLGASIPLGALGFVRAVAEVKSQIESMGLHIGHLFHCSSSGGTQAGIVAGAQIFDWSDVEIIGVSPDDASEAISAEVGHIISGIGELLEMPPAMLDQSVTVADQYVGRGYGIPSPEAQRATALLARTEGVILDPVYTSKAMAGLIDWIRSGKIPADANVLFWHTGGQLAHFYVPAKLSASE